MRIMPKRVFIESIVRIESIRCSGKLHKRTKNKLLEAAACPLQRAFCRDGRRTGTPVNVIVGTCRTQA